MNGLTEEEYELELLGFSEDNAEANSDDERQEIEEALYQAMHYAKFIVASNTINGSKDEPLANTASHPVQDENQKSTEGVVATDKLDADRSCDITNDDSEDSKYCITTTKLVNNLGTNIKKHENDIERESKKDVITISCDSNTSNILNSTIKTVINESNNDGSPNDIDSDDDACCLLIASASEDENLQVHFASKKRKGVSSPKRTTASKVTRYFEEPSSKPMTGKCFNCKQPGHFMSDCPEDKKPVSCIMCGLPGHFYKQCPNQLCFNCNLPGHEHKSCTKKRIHWKTVCKRCYMPGHEMKTCADRWRQFHLTTKSRPKLLYGAEEMMKQMYCYNCGKEGHLGYECRVDRMDCYVKVNYPFVCNYAYKEFVYMAFTQQNNDPELSSNVPLEPDPPEVTNNKKKKKKEMILKTDFSELSSNAPLEPDPPEVTNNKKKKKKKEMILKTDDTAETDLQITFSKSGKKRKIKCKDDEEVDRVGNSNETVETDLQITFSKSGKKRKIKCKNDEEVDRVGNSRETVETDLQITFSKSGKKRRIKCKDDEVKRMDNCKEIENEVKKKKKKSKKVKSTETQTNPDYTNYTNVKNADEDVNTGDRNTDTETIARSRHMETSTKTVSKKNNMEIKTGSEKVGSETKSGPREKEVAAGTSKENSTNTESPSRGAITDDEVILLKTVQKRKRLVNEEDIIVLSSDADSSKDQPEIITISDSSEDGAKKRKLDKTAVCDDDDVIVLSDGDTNAEEQDHNHGRIEINRDDEDSRTPFALVWGLPDAVCNTVKPISKKLKRLFKKNMRKHNLPPEARKKKKKNKQRTTNNSMPATTSNTDLQGLRPEQPQVKNKRFMKLRRKPKRGKKSAAETNNIASLQVEIKHETDNSNRSVSMKGKKNKFRWYKKNKNTNQTS